MNSDFKTIMVTFQSQCSEEYCKMTIPMIENEDYKLYIYKIEPVFNSMERWLSKGTDTWTKNIGTLYGNVEKTFEIRRIIVIFIKIINLHAKSNCFRMPKAIILPYTML